MRCTSGALTFSDYLCGNHRNLGLLLLQTSLLNRVSAVGRLHRLVKCTDDTNVRTDYCEIKFADEFIDLERAYGCKFYNAI